MSFSEDCVQFGDRLAKLVDAGATVREAAARLGISHQRCYAILRATGRPASSTRAGRRGIDPAAVAAVFDATGSVNAAAKASGISHASARRVLVDKGLISDDRQPYGKPQARARFLELLELGWSPSRAAREVGVHIRTARDWRDGIRKIGNTRIRPDGTVIHYADSARYTQSVTITPHAGAPVISSRYLSLPDRLAIADGLAAKQTMTAIAAGIGKHTSTVSREIDAHSANGLYLPYQADTAAAADRARPKQSKLVTNQNLRQAGGRGAIAAGCRPNRSRSLVKDFPDDESMRVSHETIYQALYFQARGGLKREVALNHLLAWLPSWPTSPRTGSTRVAAAVRNVAEGEEVTQALRLPERIALEEVTDLPRSTAAERDGADRFFGKHAGPRIINFAENPRTSVVGSSKSGRTEFRGGWPDSGDRSWSRSRCL